MWGEGRGGEVRFTKRGTRGWNTERWRSRPADVVNRRLHTPHLCDTDTGSGGGIARAVGG